MSYERLSRLCSYGKNALAKDLLHKGQPQEEVSDWKYFEVRRYLFIFESDMSNSKMSMNLHASSALNNCLHNGVLQIRVRRDMTSKSAFFLNTAIDKADDVLVIGTDLQTCRYR